MPGSNPPKPIKDLLDKKFSENQVTEVNQYVTREFQDFGCRVAEELNDPRHTPLYIKLAKEKPRALLEEALRFVSDYPQARSKGKLFMWKLKELETNRPYQVRPGTGPGPIDQVS